MSTDDLTTPLADDGTPTSPSRRTVLKRAGLAGAATAWAIPTVQTLAMSGAHAAGSPPPGTGFGTITGQVTDATTGNPISGAVVTGGGQTTTTDATGNYTLTNVPAGNTSVTASAAGYIAATSSTTVTDGGTATLNFALSPVNPANLAIRAILSWGALPRDLDLHVSGPRPDGSRFHVFYAHSTESDGTGDPYCQLDVDDTNGNGPETQSITVSDAEGDFVAGSYHVWVHNFANDADFSVSGATLNLFDQVTQRGSFPQADATGDDTRRIWRVVEFDVDDAGVVSNINPLQFMDDGNQNTVF